MLSPGEAAFNSLYYNNKCSAKRRWHFWNLRKQDFKSITQMNCFYCDIEPRQIFYGKNLYGDYTYNGVDRINNSRGYALGNVVPCCKQCNIMKSRMLVNEFYDWIERVYNHSFVG